MCFGGPPKKCLRTSIYKAFMNSCVTLSESRVSENRVYLERSERPGQGERTGQGFLLQRVWEKGQSCKLLQVLQFSSPPTTQVQYRAKNTTSTKRQNRSKQEPTQQCQILLQLDALETALQRAVTAW